MSENLIRINRKSERLKKLLEEESLESRIKKLVHSEDAVHRLIDDLYDPDMAEKVKKSRSKFVKRS